MLNRKLILLSLLLLTSCSTIDTATQNQTIRNQEMYGLTPVQHKEVAINLPEGWHQENAVATAEGRMITYRAPHGNSMMSVSFASYKGMPGASLNTVYQQLIDSGKAYCHHVEPKVLTQTSQSMTFQLNATGCPHSEDQHQIGKAIVGPDGIYVIKYSAFDDEMSMTEFNVIGALVKQAVLS